MYAHPLSRQGVGGLEVKGQVFVDKAGNAER